MANKRLLAPTHVTKKLLTLTIVIFVYSEFFYMDTRKLDASCEANINVWTRFVDTFVNFAIGGHITNPHSQISAPPPTYLPPAKRLIAIGDVHGDISKLRSALRLSGLTDDQDRWIGGSTVLVQVGDLLDRGDDEIKILYLLEKLKSEASKEGGQVHCLLGNHDTGNIDGWFKYATNGSFREFDRWAAWIRFGNSLKASCPYVEPPLDPLKGVPPHIPHRERARYGALAPGGLISTRFFASNPAVLVVGKSLFVHGGLLPHHVDYGLERINKEARDWILSKDTDHSRRSPKFFNGRDALVWSRKYSERREEDCDCSLLRRTLANVAGVERMIVGHTIQQPAGINSACGGQVIRTDVGMSKGCYNADPQVLEIRNDKEIRVLSGKTRPKSKPSDAN